jgi:hypothetical protein
MPDEPMPDDRPGNHRPGSRVQPVELAPAQRLMAHWWRLTLHRFRDYLHTAGPVRLDAAPEDADDLDR